MKIAIVGSSKPHLTDGQYIEATNQIRKLLTDFQQEFKDELVVISGHSPKGGVDIIAELMAMELGIKKLIFPAKVNRWKGGYRDRNIQIAKACDKLYSYVAGGDQRNFCRHCNARGHIRSGACWTMQRALKEKKITYQVVLGRRDTCQESIGG